jgi:hypothetical protein
MVSLCFIGKHFAWRRGGILPGGELMAIRGLVCRIATLAVAFMGATTSLSAAPIVLTFEGVGDFAEVGNFYNGGGGGNLGISFGAGSLGIVDQDAGGGGNFANEPSPDTILFFLTTTSAIMNVPAGFDTGFSFFYTNISDPGSVSVFDGPNATGNVLASLPLPVLGSNCPGDPFGDFACWAPVGVTFAGTAQSVSFAGAANFIGFDDVTLGSEVPGGPGGTGEVPEPATLLLITAGLAGLASRRVRR